MDRVFDSVQAENDATIDFLVKQAAKLENTDKTAEIDLSDIKEFRKKLQSFAEFAETLGFNLELTLNPKNSRSAFFTRLAPALIKDYFCIVSVDLQNGHFIAYSSDSRYGNINPESPGDNFFHYVKHVVSKGVYEEDRDKFIYYFERKRLMAELGKTDTVSFLFRFMLNGSPVNLQAKITETDDNHLIVGIIDVDAQVKRREEYEKAKEQSLTYSRIAQILARDYFSIYYVDIKTDRFIEYSSQQKYKSLKIEKRGDDFFKSCQENIQRVVYEDDRARLADAFNKDALIAQLDNGRSFAVSYRLVIKGEIVYASLKALRINDKDGDHILIGIKNINSQIKREQSYKKAIDKAQALAIKDALTSVKNKHAYADAETSLNERIAKNEQPEFAVVVCDINDLKAINDKYGHKVGDESIKAACATVCEIFKSSPVYRVGGDEFVVILQGADFDNRHALVALLRKQMRKNRKDGQVIMACGMAEYTDKDKNVSAVFERADENMYADKNALKTGN